MQSNWHLQLQNSLGSKKEILESNFLSSEQKDWIKENLIEADLPFLVTPHFLSLMKKDIDCPLFKQVMPDKKELYEDPILFRDPLGEEDKEKTPHLIHRYPDRVLFLLTDRCASYCRFCTRKRLVGQGPSPKREDYIKAFDYINKNEQVKEIIFSGGDPLLVSDEKIDYVLREAFLIPHIDVVRFHSRMLTFLPMRITESLCEILAQYSPIYLVTHFNHVNEISEEATKAIKMLQNAGVSLLNQSVLLRGINDDVESLVVLLRKLIKLKVKPYYLHQCDLIKGASHFRVPLEKSLALMKSLRGHISGLAQPTFVIDIPKGLGKVPLVPNFVVKEDQDFVYLSGFKDEIHAYPKI